MMPENKGRIALFPGSGPRRPGWFPSGMPDLFGPDPAVMAKAARRIEPEGFFGAALDPGFLIEIASGIVIIN